MQLNIDERSKKSDIIDGCMEYVAHVEASHVDKVTVTRLCLIAMTVGLFAGLAS